MLKQARIVRLLAICGGIMILFTLLVTVCSFLFGRTLRYVTNFTDPFGKPLPIQTYYLHDVSTSPKYEITYLIQIISLTISGVSYTAVDNFLGLLILHVCGQMENLHLRLLNLGKNQNFQALLKYNVNDHIRLIRFWIENKSYLNRSTEFNLFFKEFKLFFFKIIHCNESICDLIKITFLFRITTYIS